ncbi:MAG: iron-sulfur cluster assembly scaffold protein [Planctomycetota bacterium]
MVNAALAELLRSAPGAGELSGVGVRVGRAEHPVCGDEVEVYLRLDGDVVTEFAWRARGCPACVAVAAAAHGVVAGATLADAAARVARRVAVLGGLAPHERHALALFDAALARVAVV